MGRQVRFFMAEKDELIFLERILEHGYLILDDKGNTLTVNDAHSSNNLSLFFTFSGAHIIKSGGFVEQIESEVIQFSRCRCWSKNILESGRIWAEFKYWNSEDKLTTKGNQFSEMYTILAKWLKKTMKLSADKEYYIGEQAYQLYKEKIVFFAGLISIS